MIRLLAIVAVILASCAPAPKPAKAAAATCRVTYVVDGDTLHLDCGAGERKVRLLGFDTPEIYHPLCPAEKTAGEAATARLQGLVGSGPVTAVVFQGHDRYGRDLASLAIGGQDVAGYMLASGLALPYAGHKHPDWCARLGG
jgi:endonuclease YncB( thermonuclease family)